MLQKSRAMDHLYSFHGPGHVQDMSHKCLLIPASTWAQPEAPAWGISPGVPPAYRTSARIWTED